MTKRVVFLDIDGVMCTPRAALPLGNAGLFRVFDPVAVAFLNQLHIAAPFEIVITSTWRIHEELDVGFGMVGVQARFHEDWRTGHSFAPDVSPRPFEIDEWRSRNPGYEFIVIDDDDFAWTDEQRSRLVKCDCYDGIGMHAMQRAFDLFGAVWPVIQRRDERDDRN